VSLILSIDWDFFVAVFGPAQLIITAPTRTPGCWFELDHSYRSFWNRVHVIAGAPIVWAIHHAALSGLRRSGIEPFSSATHVVSFDAHHDGGYYDEPPTGLYDNDWTAAYPSVEVILPRWRLLTAEEDRPRVQVLQMLDDGREFPKPFAGVFICRSDDWTPEETHDAFEELLVLAPEPVVPVPINRFPCVRDAP
jgi:hypothetical protein